MIPEKGKYQSATEVLEKFIPDYVDTEKRHDDFEALNDSMSDKLSNDILADLRSKLEKFKVD